jgi:hypothetical protein
MKKFYLPGIFILSASVIYADHDNDLYVGVGAGTAEYNQSAFNVDDDLTIFALGYDYSNFYSIEAAYVDLGDVRDRYFGPSIITLTPDTLALSAEGFTIAPAFEFELSRHWSISARLGLSVMEVDKLWSGGTLIHDTYLADVGGTETEFFHGFRLQFQPNDAMSFEINWDQYEVASVEVDTVYAKANFYF